jgi:type IV pilus assembly protein PilA
MKKLNKKGFTIVELVIVIAVIAILAAVLIPTFSNVISNSKDSKAVSEVKAAYEAMHHDEMVAGYLQNAVKQGAKATAQNIASRGTRPKENGVGSGTSMVFKPDVSKLTAKDRAEIAERVARGEIISF